MRISILCSDPGHPIFPRLHEWRSRHLDRHEVEIATAADNLSGGDLLFLISCQEIVGAGIRRRYRKTLVIHASDLPEGRGWSPLVWQILEGRKIIMLTLLEAVDAVDAGAIWTQIPLRFEGHELIHELQDALFAGELELMDFAVVHFATIQPREQSGKMPTYYRKRTPQDSRIDPDKSIAEQFDLLRVADPERYPAFFDLRGRRYSIRISKADSEHE